MGGFAVIKPLSTSKGKFPKVIENKVMVRYLYLNVNSNPSISWELGMDTKVKTSEIIMNIIIGISD